MKVRVLGPVRVSQGDEDWSPGGPKERKLLAVLAARFNDVVSVETIADALWDGEPPKRPVKSVQMYVTRLRAALSTDGADGVGARVIRTEPPGYRLVLDRADLDANAFVDLVGQARGALDRGDLELAETHLASALTHWRGEPYAEFAESAFFTAEIVRLSAVRLAGMEVRLATGLAQGRHAELVPEAEALCAEHPLHERFWIHLVTALYRCGRQADALAALRKVRATLIEELGADPTPELRDLEQRVLRQDPDLLAPRAAGSVAPLPPALMPLGPTLVGRDADLAWLRRAWSAARPKPGRVVGIAGPPGSGRSRLLAEFAAELHADGVTVQFGEPGPGLVVLDDAEEVRLAEFKKARLCVVALDPSVKRNGRIAEVRSLAPLTADDVARLVTEIVGPVGTELLDQIVAASHGWPGQVERITRDLIADRSSQRVAEATARVRPASQSLSSARADIAEGVRALARVRTPRIDARIAVACPYKGLATYEQADAALFHGREELVAAVCARLVDTEFVAVVGPSGAGKSSLVRAGLLPAIADGVLPFLANAPQWIVQPAAPLPAVDGPGVIVVDQFEELFVGEVVDADRERYLDDLTSLATRPDVRVIVVIRGDFVGACAAHARLAQLVSDGAVLVGPMRADEIRRAVDLPARGVGLRVEPALVDAIVSDVDGQPGALPLLSTTLVEVWQRRSGSTLTQAAYDRAGGVSGAVARLGEAAYMSLDGPARDAARRLLVRLAESDESGTVVRRRVPRVELGDDPDTVRALAVLVGRRLLTAGERGVEVTHEAVLTYWPRLAAWLADDERGRALRRHLAPAALDWDTAGRPDTELYRGARLASALDWAGERFADLTTVERDYLTASQVLADRELHDEIARADSQALGRRRLRFALVAALCLLLVATGAAVLAVDRQHAAADASRQSLARRLGALALVTQDLDRALLLAVQAIRTYDERETRGDLLAVLSRSSPALRQVRGPVDKGVIAHLALSPDGSTVVGVAGGGGRVLTWAADTLVATSDPVTIGQTARSVIAGSDPHGVFIAAALAVETQNQAIVHWDAVDHRVVATYPLPPGVIGSARRAALTSDGQILTVPTLGRSLLFFDVGAGRLRGRLELPEPAGDVWRLGSFLVTAPVNGTTAYIVDAATARLVHTLRLPAAGNVTASPDGRSLLVVSGARAALVATDDGRVIREYAGATRSATVAAFSPDGTTVAVGGDDSAIGVWDVATGELRDTLRGHAAPVGGLVFAADGRTLYSSAADNSVIAWDVAGDRSFTARANRAAPLPAPRSNTTGLTTIVWPVVGWSADRRSVYISAVDGASAALVDVETGQVVRRLTPYTLDPSAAAPVADVDRQAMLATTADGVVERRELSSNTVVASGSASPPYVRFAVAVSGDGRVLATVADDAENDDHRLEILDARTLEVRARLGPIQHAAFALWLSGDGSLLAVSSEVPGHHVELWDTRTGQRRWISDVGEDQGLAMAASPDNRTLVMGTFRGAAVTIDLATGAVRSRLGQRIPTRIESADYSPDGSLIALSGEDGQVHLFDAATLREIGALPTGTGGRWAFAAFSTDGTRLSAVDERGLVVGWDVRPSAWIDRACSIVGRDFTKIEWDTYLGGSDYQTTCRS